MRSGSRLSCGVVQQRSGVGFAQAWGETLADRPSLPVAAIGVESVADHRPAVANDVGYSGDQKGVIFQGVDVGIRNRRMQWAKKVTSRISTTRIGAQFLLAVEVPLRPYCKATV